MPEGDSLYKVAARLGPALTDAELVAFEAPRLVGDRPRRGERIESVEAVGKWLRIAFSGGLTLETHLRMTGSWHLHRAGERWRKPAHLMRVRVATADGWEAVCFSAPVVRTGPTARRAGRDDPLGHLGPDLCRIDPADDTAVGECLRRMESLGAGRSVGEVLLDQRICCGVGNVYRSEVCWHAGVDPATPIDGVPVERRRRLVELSARLLQANLGPGRRTTVPGGLAVYGLARRPCRRCGTPIRVAHQGEQARIVYWCPRCQPRR